MATIRLPPVVLALCAAFMSLPGPNGNDPLLAATPLRSILDDYYQVWLESVFHHITDTERRRFESLTGDVEREVFIRRFWQARDPQARHHRYRPLLRWHDNLEAAQGRFVSLSEDRAKATLLAGKPARVHFLRSCRGEIRPLEIWTYTPWHVRYQTGERGEGFTLLFVQEKKVEPRFYRQWSRRDGISPLIYSQPSGRLKSVQDLVRLARSADCFPGDVDGVAVFTAALANALGGSELRRRLTPRPPDPAWLDVFDTPLGAGTLPSSSIEVRYPGKSHRNTIVHGRLFLPVEDMGRNAQGVLLDRVTIVGDIRSAGGRTSRLVDSFRVVHHIAGSNAKGRTIPVDFYRRLLPGAYTLSLRAEDRNGLALLREQRTLEVPKLDTEAVSPAGFKLGLSALTRREVVVLTTFPSVELLNPGNNLLVGDVEIEAVTTGGPIERVEFRLDDSLTKSDHDPPYAAELPLGPTPRSHRAEAIAYDPLGRELARDSLWLNARPQRFAVTLTQPPTGQNRAEAVVEIPAEKRLLEVEFFLNQAHLLTLHRPPFVCPLPELPEQDVNYLRAVATLTSGETMEDLIFLGSRLAVDEIEVQLVELYTSVFDPQGRPVTDLGAHQFRVFEDGEEQRIQQVNRVRNLAINVALVMDTSSSMRRKVRIAALSAQRFFEQVLTPKDLASLLTFNHDIRHVVPFTNDVDLLRYGASGLRAWGSTRLNDSLIYATHSFGGLQSKRALVVLTDGADVDSDFPFEQVVEHTLRSAVAVYPIVLGGVGPATQSSLGRLAHETGGRSFGVQTPQGLDEVYRRIEEELRSQYLLVYRPPPRKNRREFRRVRVEVAVPDLRARTIHGYYP